MRRVRSATRAIAAAAGGVLVAAVVAGCAGYSANVTNRTTRTVYAAVFERSASGAMKLLATEAVGPDSDETVGPVSTPADSQAVLIVDVTPSPRQIRWIVLRQGTTRYEVTQINDMPAAPIQVRETD
ncbi:MAG: hypothetical protein KF745_08555 [Phycisphaeraceae bacterium]|nr:hypothetical protein [Phycisphaeraceae bacterium]